MLIFETFFGFIGDIFSLLNDTEVFGTSLGFILLGFVITSFAISVFWKGARG